MTQHRDPHEEWRLEKKVPVALLLALLTQTFFFGWYGSNMTTRVDQLERQVTAIAMLSERTIRLEEKIGGVQQGIGEIKSMMRPAPTPATRTNDPG